MDLDRQKFYPEGYAANVQMLLLLLTALNFNINIRGGQILSNKHRSPMNFNYMDLDGVENIDNK